jgi:xanthine dehydrogenase small subunit
MRDYVLLYVNGRRCEVRGSAAFQPLSDLLRSEQRLVGTKVVCAEGDCGSCTVLIGRPRADKLEYRPVTSCIQYVAQLDGAHVVTVEGLSEPGQLNPVQESFVTNHGAQCGFCTPGFIASLCGLFETNPQPTRQETARALVGNLCRCTGYDSILASAAAVDGAKMPRLAERYPEASLAAELGRAAGEAITLNAGTRQLFKPATLAEAVALRAAHPDAAVLAGGTDLGVVWNKGKRELGSLLCLGEVPELREHHVDGKLWTIGAGVTLADVERTAAERIPAFARLLERFGSPPIRNAGTIGGNIANGSPIGDSMPCLFALGAAVELIGPGGSRRVLLDQFYTGYRKTVMRADELIARVVVPLLGPDERFTVHKVSKRFDLDISTFAAALWVRMQGEKVAEARIAYGGVAATIVRVPTAEAALVGRSLDDATLHAAGRAARDAIKPISDVRGSDAYRKLLAENVLLKLGRELRGRQSTAAANGQTHG